MLHDVHERGQVTQALRRVASRISQVRCNVNDRVLVSRPGGVLVHTRLQALFNLRFETPVEQAIHQLIVTHAHAAESLGPGGFDDCIELLLEKLDRYLDGGQPVVEKEKLSDILGASVTYPTRDDVEWVLNEHLSSVDERTRSMLLNALNLAGFAGRIIIEKTKARPSVELVRGYTFEQSPVWPLSVKLVKPKVVCVDGYIEAVSELHHLLEAASDSKESVILFVRGMSDDVKNTLKVNYDRGTLKVVPIIVKFDIEGINAINDIAIATGADLISSNKGDLISNIDLATAPRVESAVVHMNKVVITNTKTKVAVSIHVAGLRKKRADQKIDDVGKLIDLRIKSLSPNHVVVRLSDDKDYVVSSQAIDYALRAIRALVDYGTIHDGTRKRLSVSVLAARIHSRRCFETLTSLGAMVTQGS